MIGHELVAQRIVLKRPSPGEPEPRCKVCGKPLLDWRPGMALICPDHNPNRQRLIREGQVPPSDDSFDEWIQATLWYVAAP